MILTFSIIHDLTPVEQTSDPVYGKLPIIRDSLANQNPIYLQLPCPCGQVKQQRNLKRKLAVNFRKRYYHHHFIYFVYHSVRGEFLLIDMLVALTTHFSVSVSLKLHIDRNQIQCHVIVSAISGFSSMSLARFIISVMKGEDCLTDI